MPANTWVYTATMLFTVPATWSNTNNRIECIGAGGAGFRQVGNTTSFAGGGGGGGSYARLENVTLGVGQVLYVNVAGPATSNTNGGNSWVNIAGSNTQPTSIAQGPVGVGGQQGTLTVGGRPGEGNIGNLTRHHVVPHCYRRNFPQELKAYCSHDVLPLCHSCHEVVS